MKKTKIIGFALLAILIGVVGFYSCEKTYVEPEAPTEILEAPKLIMAPGVWKITSFQWKNKTENDRLYSYMFIFNQDGTIHAIHDNMKEFGKFTKKENILVIRFLSSPLTQLNNRWTIVGHTTTTFDLKGLNQEDGSSEYVTFEKIKSTTLGEPVE